MIQMKIIDVFRNTKYLFFFANFHEPTKSPLIKIHMDNNI